MYFDGHERPDVVEYRNKFITEVATLCERSRIYSGDNLEVEEAPKNLGGQRETVFVYHDKSTVHANKRRPVTWMLPTVMELRVKSPGRLIHISDFIVLTCGRLKILPEAVSKLELDGLGVPSATDAAVVIYPGARGDQWWNMDQLIKQVKTRAIPIFEVLHPKSQGVFVFDCSSAHEPYGPSALRVQNMNLKHGGKQGSLRDTFIPSDDIHIPEHLRGLPQRMVFPSDHPDPHLAGKPKGLQVVLEERGLWGHYNSIRLQKGKPPLAA